MQYLMAREHVPDFWLSPDAIYCNFTSHRLAQEAAMSMKSGYSQVSSKVL
jgi:hypothetical protein